MSAMLGAVAAARNSRRFTLLLGMAVLLVFGFLMTRPPSALAAVLKKQTCSFYTDGTFTTQVGYQVYRCNGSVAQTTGTVTAFSLCDQDWCCGAVWC